MKKMPFYAVYQKLNVLVVLGDTLDVRWVLPGGETYGIQGATA